MNWCQCGAEAGYPHAADCPWPYFGDAPLRVAQWERDRAALAARLGNWSVSIMANPGDDVNYPADAWPFMVFLRCMSNPLASGWTFLRTKAEADARRAEIQANIDGDKLPKLCKTCGGIHPRSNPRCPQEAYQ